MSLFDAVPLRGLDEASRQRISAAGRTQTLSAGQRLFDVGDDADALFVVLRGRVAVRADAGVLRVAEPGHTLGEEALLGLPRRGTAEAQDDAEVFSVTASLLQRAWTRAGGRPVAAAERRRLERAVIGDLLRAKVPGLDGWALELLLDGASLRAVEADSYIARAGDPMPCAALLLDGVAHVRPVGSREVTALATSPDALGVRGTLDGQRWPDDVVAAGVCQVVWIRADALRSGLGAAAHDLEAGAQRQAEARAGLVRGMQVGPRDLPVDVHRLARARSLLVIDQDACVRCGQCTRSCAASHDDGLARMRRSGPRLLARVGGADSAAAPWLLAQACQHCSSPACLPDCPTAAITRGQDGVVRIDPSLCTGCGACAKACPWDAVEMAPRPPGTPSPQGEYGTVAVKCDLCVGRRAGPACAEACPTAALQRVDAGAEIAEVAALLDRPLPSPRPRRQVGPWVASVGIAGALSLGAWGASMHDAGWIAGAGPGLRMGWLAAVAMIFSVGYGGLRRVRGQRGPAGMALHGTLGALSLGAAWAHGGGHFQGLPGLLIAVLLLATGLGMWGLLAYRVLPSRLTRLEAEADDEREEVPDAADALMKAVGGRGDALKHLTAAVLLPYARRVGGGVSMVFSGRSLAQEQARLKAKLVRTLGAERIERMEGLDDVLSTVVTLRARTARGVLRFGLRGWLAPHVVLATVSVGLLGVHLVGVLG